MEMGNAMDMNLDIDMATEMNIDMDVEASG
jgi:hypothetical protein